MVPSSDTVVLLVSLPAWATATPAVSASSATSTSTFGTGVAVVYLPPSPECTDWAISTSRLSPTLSMSSSAPRTVTVWGSSQLSSVNVRSREPTLVTHDRPFAGPSTSAPAAGTTRTTTVWSASGAEFSTTV